MTLSATISRTMFLLFCGLSLVTWIGISEEEKETDAARMTREKLERIVIPSVEFVDTPLPDALEFLTQRSVELDSEGKPAKKGVGIILDAEDLQEAAGKDEAGKGFEPTPVSPEGDKSLGEKLISLKLENVTVAEALRRILKNCGMKYVVEPDGAVNVVPLEQTQ